MKHCLIQDDDGHWYVIPSGKKKEFNSYMKNPYAYWPNWIVQIDGPHKLTFNEYEAKSI